MADPAILFEGDDRELDLVVAGADAGEADRESYSEDDREQKGKSEGETVANEYLGVLRGDQQTLAQYRRHGG